MYQGHNILLGGENKVSKSWKYCEKLPRKHECFLFSEGKQIPPVRLVIIIHALSRLPRGATYLGHHGRASDTQALSSPPGSLVVMTPASGIWQDVFWQVNKSPLRGGWDSKHVLGRVPAPIYQMLWANGNSQVRAALTVTQVELQETPARAKPTVPCSRNTQGSCCRGGSWIKGVWQVSNFLCYIDPGT